MPSITTTSGRRRRRHSRLPREGFSNRHAQPQQPAPASSQRCRRETLASKIKKRMLEEQTHDGGGKGIRIDGEDVSQRQGMSNGSWGSAGGSEHRVTRVMTAAPQLYRHLINSPCLPHFLYTASLGVDSAINRRSVLGPVVRDLSELRLFLTASPFDRRVTALDWHPTMPGMVIAGSKGGDLILWNCLRQNLTDHFVQGIGAGGSIQAMKAWPWNGEAVVTAAIDGRVVVRHWTQGLCQVLANTTNCMECWYCSVDVSAPLKAVVTGDNMGNTLLLSSEGKKLWNYRLHKQKVTHTEFSPREDWLFITASIDSTVKVWDLRMVSGSNSSLAVLKHLKPLNSAYFSRTDGCRLLTTDQYSEVRVYRSPFWHLERTIQHPHRFFQHLTPIKATWHPLQDLAVIGRYPCKDFRRYTESELRTIDIIDVNTGDILYQLSDPSAPGIVSLNKFSDRGDYLVSGMGLNLLLWGGSHDVESRQNALLNNYMNSDLGLLMAERRGARGQSARKRPLSSSDKSKVKGSDVKVKVKTQPSTKTRKR